MTVTAKEPDGWTCSDVIAFSAGTQWTWGNLFTHGEHNYWFDLTDEDLQLIEARGLQAYQFCDTAFHLVYDAVKTIEL